MLFRKKRRVFYATITVVVFCLAVIAKYSAIRTTGRWLLFSRRYKAEVLAQPAQHGEFRHVEWDGWGWGGQDTTVYLVFDPTDSLLAAARNRGSGKFSGIPCEVYGVHRLEKNWYTVQFFTNESWGRTNIDCSGSISYGRFCGASEDFIYSCNAGINPGSFHIAEAPGYYHSSLGCLCRSRCL